MFNGERDLAKGKVTLLYKFLSWELPASESWIPQNIPKTLCVFGKSANTLSTLWATHKIHRAWKLPTGLLPPLTSSKIRHDKLDNVCLEKLGYTALTKSKS